MSKVLSTTNRGPGTPGAPVLQGPVSRRGKIDAVPFTFPPYRSRATTDQHQVFDFLKMMWLLRLVVVALLLDVAVGDETVIHELFMVWDGKCLHSPRIDPKR